MKEYPEYRETIHGYFIGNVFYIKENIHDNDLYIDGKILLKKFIIHKLLDPTDTMDNYYSSFLIVKHDTINDRLRKIAYLFFNTKMEAMKWKLKC